MHSFVSPASNKRTDEYGGSFENRTRLTRELVELTRANIPKEMPLFLRISGTDWLEEEPDMDSWKVEDTVKLAEMIAPLGVDFLDVSSGGLHPKQKIKGGPNYQAVSFLLTPPYTRTLRSNFFISAIRQSSQSQTRRQNPRQHCGHHQEWQAGQRVARGWRVGCGLCGQVFPEESWACLGICRRTWRGHPDCKSDQMGLCWSTGSGEE